MSDRLQPLQLRCESEKVRLDDLRSLQQKKEDLQVRLQQAKNRFDLAMVADIRYPQPTASYSLVLKCCSSCCSMRARAVHFSARLHLVCHTGYNPAIVITNSARRLLIDRCLSQIRSLCHNYAPV